MKELFKENYNSVSEARKYKEIKQPMADKNNSQLKIIMLQSCPRQTGNTEETERKKQRSTWMILSLVTSQKGSDAKGMDEVT